MGIERLGTMGGGNIPETFASSSREVGLANQKGIQISLVEAMKPG